MKKRLGIDIDGTVTCPKTIIPYMNQDFRLNIRYEDVKEYDLSTLVNVPKDEFAKWWERKEEEIYRDSPLAEGAKEILLQLEKKFELIFISARGKEYFDLTKNWFHKQGISCINLELLGSHYKIEAAKKWGVDAFLEDKHDNAVEIHEKLHIPVLLFQTPYNQEPVPKGVYRVKNWEEAWKTLNQLFPM